MKEKRKKEKTDPQTKKKPRLPSKGQCNFNCIAENIQMT